ncbi:putative flippase GtrA [Tahibacter aquaticus]|uniref:Putative flippase GtrA n=1 Tax=Tahibacter aquaticus TaxID=520092 RepID=A0A4R6ZA53_9GAMM|nr:GtrA family protein [Tahibacter aquaticus]TDR48817.1 putative flippase GtrA [Tahibacter aquaticus]
MCSASRRSSWPNNGRQDEHPRTAGGVCSADRPLKRQLVTFIAVSAIAALMNFASRAAFSLVLPYALAIMAAFVVGLSTAFVLNRRFVFVDGHGHAAGQLLRFTLVNLAGLALTLAVSLLLVHVVLPAAGWRWHAEEVAHAIGIAAPILMSFFGHKYFSFRKNAAAS